MSPARVKISLFSIYLLYAILLNSVGAVILQSIASFGVTKQDASLLEAFKDLPIAFVSFLVASSLPRLGYRRAMTLAVAAVAAACLAMALIPAFLTTKLLFLTVGASFALVKVSVYSTIGLLTNDAKGHASLLNLIEGLFMVGVLAGYFLFAAFIDPAQASSTAWTRVYLPLALLAAANAILLAVTRFPPPPAPGEARLAQDFKEMLALLWRPSVIVFAISAFFYVLIEQGVGTWLPTFNNEVLRLPPAMSVQAASIFAAALAAGRLGAGMILKRMNWYPLLNICLFCMGALIMLTLPATRGLEPRADISWFNAPVAAFILPLIGLFLAPIYPAINSVILSSLPRNLHAAMTGLIVIFSALGGTTGSFITGRSFARFGGETAFLFSLAPMAALFFLLWLLRRVINLREERAPDVS
ncbi:MAG: MFS transporter [Alphaproteobacteria bacterium RIFCSPHIGHO2_12_FULL_63_12]|nr:MAG: MFS transporter [Alphaproteobacteria bacterium RIFCSPHIGHO2_12_FULL_63_12]